MKKLLSIALIAVMALSTLAACGGGQQSATSVDPAPSGDAASGESAGSQPATSDSEITVNNQLVGRADAPIEITFQPDPGHWLTSTDAGVAAYMERKAREWIEAHPDVKIVPVAQSVNITDSMGKLLIQAAAGNAPDLAEVDSFVLPSFKQYLQPLDDVLAERGIDKSSWFPFAQEGMTYNDQYVALWHTTDVRVFYYNKTFMDSAPTNWDELITVGEQMAEQGHTPLLYPAGRNETTSCDILPWFWSQGGKLVDDSGAPIFDQGDNRTYLVGTLDYIKRTIDTGVSPSRISTFGTDSDMNNEVSAGKVAMFFGGSWLSSQLRQIMGDEEFIATWGIAPIPMKEGAERTSTAGGWTAGVFTTDDEKRKLAADFAISLYIDDDAMEEYSATSGNLPCRSVIFDSSETFKNDPILAAYGEELQYAQVRPGVEIYNTISQELQVAISDVITGSADPETAVETMSRNVANQS